MGSNPAGRTTPARSSRIGHPDIVRGVFGRGWQRILASARVHPGRPRAVAVPLCCHQCRPLSPAFCRIVASNSPRFSALTRFRTHSLGLVRASLIACSHPPRATPSSESRSILGVSRRRPPRVACSVLRASRRIPPPAPAATSWRFGPPKGLTILGWNRSNRAPPPLVVLGAAALACDATPALRRHRADVAKSTT